MASKQYWPADLDGIDPFDGNSALQRTLDQFSSAPPLSRMKRFRTRKLRQWDAEDTRDWVFCTCKEQNIDSFHVNTAGFSGLTGQHLAEMKEDEFMTIDLRYGRELFEALAPYKKLKTSGGKLISENKTKNYGGNSPLVFDDQYSNEVYSNDYPYINNELLVDSFDSLSDYPQDLSESPCNLLKNLSLESSSELPPYNYDPIYPLQPALNDGSSNYFCHGIQPRVYQDLSPCRFDISDDSDELSNSLLSPPLSQLTQEDLYLLDNSNNEHLNTLTPYWDLLGTDPQCQPGTSASTASMNLRKRTLLSPTPEFLAECGKAIAGSRRQRNVSGIGCVSSPKSSRTSSPNKMKNPRKSKSGLTSTGLRTSSGSPKKEPGKKVWEFLLDLLNDPNSNPSLIRWENESEGVFRLVEHDLIAQKWGMRRDRGDLSYDYFARTMRYQYTTGKLESVPERKLVYKFGPDVMKLLK